MWVFHSNEKADTKSALSLRVTSWKFQLLTLFIVLLGWSLESGNNFRTVAQETSYKLGTVGGRQEKSSLSRRDEVVINRHRLRIGHTRCTHSICCQVQTNLSAWHVSVHSLLSTSFLSVLIITILALNILFCLFRWIVQYCWRTWRPWHYQRN